MYKWTKERDCLQNFLDFPWKKNTFITVVAISILKLILNTLVQERNFLIASLKKTGIYLQCILPFIIYFISILLSEEEDVPG